MLDIDSEVRRRQLERLSRKAAARAMPSGRRSPWAHVPLRAILEQGGNAIHEKGSGGELETGHKPFHTSKTGRCLRLSPEAGIWYCRNCKVGGDALTYWMLLHGLKRRDAAEQLAAKYGPPKKRRRTAVRWVEL